MLEAAAAAAAAAARPVLVDGDPRLRAPAAAVGDLDAAARADAAVLAATLAALRTRHGFGRGLAAPQLGIGRRMIALDLGAGPFVLFDPRLAWRSPELFEVWDDCFSVPDRLVRVRRHASVTVVYRDARGRVRRWERLPPDLAELLQHELDHLDGVLMLDRAIDAAAIRPAADRAELVDAARPRHRLSVAAIAEAARGIDPVFRGAPVIESEPLGALAGCRLWLAIETLNPIRCFKGRGADWFVSRLALRGAPRPLVCASAGNFGQAMAYACRRRGLPIVVYAATSASPLKLARMRELGAEVVLAGDDFDAAKAAARRFAAATGHVMVEDGLQPEISEGAGSLGVELCARAPDLDAVVVPVGNGALLAGVARWIKAADPAIRVFGACSRGAPAMEESWRTSTVVTHPRTATIADGIAVRVPIPEALDDLRGLVDDMWLVDDAELIAAMRLVHAHAGLVTEPAGAVGVAAVLAAEGRERLAGQHVATIITGGNLADLSLLLGPAP
jgi:threonine dehydratase/peptide deformylase